MGKLFNRYGMGLADIGKNEESESLLKEVLKLLESYNVENPTPQVIQMTGLTYNNLSCIYKRADQITDSLRCLIFALHLQSK